MLGGVHRLLREGAGGTGSEARDRVPSGPCSPGSAGVRGRTQSFPRLLVNGDIAWTLMPRRSPGQSGPGWLRLYVSGNIRPSWPSLPNKYPICPCQISLVVSGRSVQPCDGRAGADIQEGVYARPDADDPEARSRLCARRWAAAPRAARPAWLGIAKTPIGHHVNGCRIVEIECRHRISQDHKMASGRGQRLRIGRHRSSYIGKTLLRPGGATLVEVVAEIRDAMELLRVRWCYLWT